MTGKLSTFERRIEILFFIISSKKVTLSELSKKYSVHKNTVYNDITLFRSLRSHPCKKRCKRRNILDGGLTQQSFPVFLL